MIDCLLYPEPAPVDPGLTERLKNLRTSLVSDVFGRWSGAPGVNLISGLGPSDVVVGPAFTVRTRPGDNLVLHKALDIAPPGSVMVVDGGGATGRALLGGLMGLYAARRGLAAIVIDGAVRDRSDLAASAPPVFARAISQLGPYKDGPGDLRGPVSIGGLVVECGDLIIGDEDGIAVVPRLRAEEIISAAEAKKAAEDEEEKSIRSDSWDRSWLDDKLRLIEHDRP